MKEPIRTITRQQYLIALGLFHLAHGRYQESRTFESELCKLLGLEDGSHVSDAICTENDSLEAALEREGIQVEV